MTGLITATETRADRPAAQRMKSRLAARSGGAKTTSKFSRVLLRSSHRFALRSGPRAADLGHSESFVPQPTTDVSANRPSPHAGNRRPPRLARSDAEQAAVKNA